MAQTTNKLDTSLQRAAAKHDHGFIDMIAKLRVDLFYAAIREDWITYNEIARELNTHGASISLVKILKAQEEYTQMGMFDAPQYLTGDKGFVDAGETFFLHNARLMEARVMVNGKEREQVKLQVSRDLDGEKVIVFSSGAAIVNQVKRMDNKDRQNMPMELRLDQVPSKNGNAANVMTPAGEPAPSGDFGAAATSGDDF